MPEYYDPIKFISKSRPLPFTEFLGPVISITHSTIENAYEIRNEDNQIVARITSNGQFVGDGSLLTGIEGTAGDFVSLTADQTINGNKTFANNLVVNGGVSVKDQNGDVIAGISEAGLIVGDGSGITNIQIAPHNHSIAEITNLEAELGAAVRLTGDQIIVGTKTFSTPIITNVTGTASNITGVAAVSNGGTGRSSLTLNTLLAGNGASSVQLVTLNSTLTLSGGVLSVSTHNHDDRYYTETETDALLLNKSSAGHTHSAADITVGVMSTARLGTGTANTTNYLRGDGTWSTVDVGVTSVSVASANGFGGAVATYSTTPVITINTNVNGILKGNGTAVSAAVAGTDYASATHSHLAADLPATIVYTTGSYSNPSWLTSIASSKLSGLVSAANLGSGTADSTTYLRGDGTWSVPPTGGGGSSGTVTNVSISPANGFSGTVANPSTTPAITISTTVNGLLKGNGTSISSAVAGTDYASASHSHLAADLPATIVYTTGSYANPTWLTSLAGSKLSGVVAASNLGSGTASSTTYLRGDGTWVELNNFVTLSDNQTIVGTKTFSSAIAGSVTGSAATITGSITTTQISNLGSWAGSTSITTLGTIVAGTWTGSIIAPQYLGSGTRDGTKYLRDDGTWVAVASGGSGGTATPGGLTTQVQFNDNGAFAGHAGLTYNSGNAQLSATRINIPTTTAVGDGVIYQGGNRLIHTLNNSSVFVGSLAGGLSSTGNNNTAVGYSTLNSLTTGSANCAFGTYSLFAITSGENNTAVGNNSLASATTASTNTAIGNNSLYNLVSGSDNVAIGHNSISGVTSGNSNVAVGTNIAGSLTNINNFVGIGSSIGSNWTGAGATVAIGSNIGRFSDNQFGSVLIGYDTGDRASWYSTMIGFGVSNNATGSNITALGANSATNLTTGNNNTFIGAGSGVVSGAIPDKSTALGFNSRVSASNNIILGGSGTDACRGGIGGITAAEAQWHVECSEQNNIGLIVRANAIQASPIFQIQNSGGTALVSVNEVGIISGNASGLTSINANGISAGTVSPARLGSGTADSTTFLRGDGTWAIPPTGEGGVGGSGTVTSVSISPANGFGGSVANSTTTPAITINTTVNGLLKGDGTAVSAAVVGTDYASATHSHLAADLPTSLLYDTGSYANPTWLTSLAGSKVSGNIAGNAANVTGTVAIANGGTGSTTATAARTSLGLVIGTDVLAPNGSGVNLTGVAKTAVINTFVTGQIIQAATGQVGLDIQPISGQNVLNLRGATTSTIRSAFDQDAFGFIDKATFVLAIGNDLVNETNRTLVGVLAGFAGKIVKWKALAKTNPVGGGFAFDILRNGTTIFSSAPSIAANITTVQSGNTFANTLVNENDEFTINITGAGTGVRSVNITLYMLTRNT